MAALYALIAVLLVSLVSLMGALFLIFKRKTIESLITYTLAVSSGILLGTAFLDLLPESTEMIGAASYAYILAGFISFFTLEKLLQWHHCVDDDEHSAKPVGYLTLVGDAVHNFIDGVIIGVAFLTSIPVGIATTIAVIAHEVPHELGDFSILLHGGFSPGKALWYNLLSALTAVLGTLAVLVFSPAVEGITAYLVAFAAGNFLYIAATDLIPELHKKRTLSSTFTQLACILGGVMMMQWLIQAIEH